jgi:predicted metal-dependent peptidase
MLQAYFITIFLLGVALGILISSKKEEYEKEEEDYRSILQYFIKPICEKDVQKKDKNQKKGRGRKRSLKG